MEKTVEFSNNNFMWHFGDRDIQVISHGSLSAPQGTSSGCECRRRLPGMEGNSEYTEYMWRAADKE
jgi:hypothetical protein